MPRRFASDYRESISGAHHFLSPKKVRVLRQSTSARPAPRAPPFPRRPRDSDTFSPKRIGQGLLLSIIEPNGAHYEMQSPDFISPPSEASDRGIVCAIA